MPRCSVRASVLGAVQSLQDVGVHDVARRGPGQQPAQVVGDGLGVVDLGVVGGAPDVRGEHDVREGGERVVGGKVLADEVVEARRADLPRPQRGRRARRRRGAGPAPC